jgi:hypothetical protein
LEIGALRPLLCTVLSLYRNAVDFAQPTSGRNRARIPSFRAFYTCAGVLLKQWFDSALSASNNVVAMAVLTCTGSMVSGGTMQVCLRPYLLCCPISGAPILWWESNPYPLRYRLNFVRAFVPIALTTTHGFLSFFSHWCATRKSDRSQNRQAGGCLIRPDNSPE